MKGQRSLYFIVIGAFLLFISGSFLSEGISRVGMDNAVVSQRMSEGFEEFWLPSMTAPGNPDRSNYLPLGYWIESKWFGLFSANSFMADKVFSVLTYFVIAALMLWIWSLMGQNRKTGWLPLMCWIMIPLVTWSATNNLLESTMTMFVLLSVVFLLKSGKASFIARSRLATGKKTGPYKLSRTTWVVLAALMMELAFLVKGFAGLFPIFFPILYWLIVRRERVLFPLFTTGVILVVWMVTFFIVTVFSPDTYHHLYNYLHHQMIGGVLHVQTVASHFYIVYALMVQLAIPFFIAIIISLIRIKSRPFLRYILFWRNNKKVTAEQSERARMGWFFFAMGVSGILPVMLGLKQQEFYMVPTLPFFAIALACFLYNMLEDWLESINKTAQWVLMGLAILIFGSGIVLNINSLNKINSNHVLLGDMRMILPYLENGETISVSPEVMNSPEAEEYFYRYKQIKFDTALNHTFLLTMYEPNAAAVKERYSDMGLHTSQYKLYQLGKNKVKTETVMENSDESLNLDENPNEEENENEE